MLLFVRMLMLLLVWSSVAQGREPEARRQGDDLEILADPGSRVRLLSESEQVIARGRVSSEGRLLFRGQGAADAMLRIVEIDGRRRSLSALYPTVELLAVFPDRVVAGLPLEAHVQVVHRDSGQGVADVPLALALRCEGEGVSRVEWRSGEGGVAEGDALYVPAHSATPCRLEVEGAGATLSKDIEVTREAQLMVSADRPVYRPGNRVHVRALALQAGGRAPIASAEGTIELLDANGRVLLRESVVSDDFGVSAATLQLAETLTVPALQLRYQSQGESVQKRLRVGEYQRPRVEVRVTPVAATLRAGGQLQTQLEVLQYDGAAAEGATVTLDARGPDGSLWFRSEGETDADGLLTLGGRLPDDAAEVRLKAHVETTSGHSARAEQRVAVDRGEIELFLIPESGAAVAGLDNAFWVVTQKAAGAAVGADVVIRAGREEVSLRTDSEGLGRATLRIPADQPLIVAQAVSASGSARRELRVDSGATAGLLKLDNAVVEGRKPIQASLHVAGGQDGRAIFEVVQAEQVLSSQAVPLLAGRAAVAVAIPAGVSGTIQVQAWTRHDRVTVGDARVVFIRDDRDLTVSLALDREKYAPGESATVSVQVRDGSDRPVVASVGLVALDAGLRHFGLEQPGAERALARLGGSWSPHTGVAPQWARGALLESANWRRLSVLSSAAALATPVVTPRESGAIRRQASQAAFQPQLRKRVDRLATALTEYFRLKGQRAGSKELAGEGDASTSLTTRVEAWQLVVMGRLPSRVLRDPWGEPLIVDMEGRPLCCDNRVSISSAGIDGRHGTADDLSAEAYFRGAQEVSCGCGHGGMGFFGLGRGGGGAIMGQVRFGAGSVGSRGAPIRLRRNFPDTLAVEPSLITDREGRASWTVSLADSVTTWLIQARAVSSAGGLGGAEEELRVSQPFSVDVALPAALTRSDELEVPVSLTNRTSQNRTVSVDIRTDGAITGGGQQRVTVAGGSTATVTVRLKAERVGSGGLEIRAAGEGVVDGVRRDLKVEADGVPVSEVRTGTLRAGTPTQLAIAVPSGGIEGTQRLTLRTYPSPIGTVVEGLDALLAAPAGCFEQTSATTYPNALVLDYLERSDQASPEVATRARAFLKAGWDRLRSFEVQGGGFSWFGQAPANRILTAFGVMEFERMGRVIPVDSALVQRTRAWLLGQREADGSFRPDAEYLHAESWGRIQNASLPVTAYIVWALARGGNKRELESSVRWIRAHSSEAEDAYVLSLVALALSTVDAAHPTSVEARRRLEALSIAEGSGRRWPTSMSTHTYAGGDSASIETTGLGTLALLAGEETNDASESALSWLLSKRRPGGSWGTTQSTVLALDALLEFEARAGQPVEGTLAIDANGKSREALHFDLATWDVVKSLELGSEAGPHELDLRLSGAGRLRYQLASTRHVPLAELPEQTSPLNLSVIPAKTHLSVGERVPVQVRVAAGATAVRMPTLRIGLPAGFDVDDAGLENRGAARIETLGRTLVVYLTRLDAGQSFEGRFELIARRAGSMTPGLSSAWPYYEPDRIAYRVPPRFNVSP